MDDVQNISATLYGKAEPATAKTTMSVREMQHLLGLGKTDSYWLLHKNFFEVILINDKMRIVNIIRSMVLRRARNFASGHILFWKLLKY